MLWWVRVGFANNAKGGQLICIKAFITVTDIEIAQGPGYSNVSNVSNVSGYSNIQTETSIR